MGASLRQLVLVGTASAVVAVSGIVVYQTAPPMQFGWFAYSPLSDEVLVRSSSHHSPQQVAGVALVALGLVGASVTAGYWLVIKTLRTGQFSARS